MKNPMAVIWPLAVVLYLVADFAVVAFLRPDPVLQFLSFLGLLAIAVFAVYDDGMSQDEE